MARRKTEDANETAFRVMRESTGDPLKTKTAKPKATTTKTTKSMISQVMAEMGRRGGKIGGKRRMVTLTPEERSGIALKAAQARWANKKRSAS